MANLIVENGTGLETSNSYVSVDEFKQFADLNGLDLTNFTDDKLANFIVISTNYINSFESVMVGKRLNPEQALAFPRIIESSCNANPHLYNMRNLKMAVFYGVDAQVQGFSLLPTTITKDDIIKKEKIEGLEVQYSDEMLDKVVSGEFPMIKRFLSEYLVSRSHSLKVSR